MMIKVSYPSQKPSLKVENGKEVIFCIARKRWMLVTPEEWVRQNFLLYLVNVLGFPLSLIAVEKQFNVGEMKKRFDIVVYQSSGAPYIVVECKEMDTALTEGVLQQILRYNISLRANFLVITNGLYCAAFKHQDSLFEMISEIPSYTDGDKKNPA